MIFRPSILCVSVFLCSAVAVAQRAVPVSVPVASRPAAAATATAASPAGEPSLREEVLQRLGAAGGPSLSGVSPLAIRWRVALERLAKTQNDDAARAECLSEVAACLKGIDAALLAAGREAETAADGDERLATKLRNALELAGTVAHDLRARAAQKDREAERLLEEKENADAVVAYSAAHAAGEAPDPDVGYAVQKLKLQRDRLAQDKRRLELDAEDAVHWAAAYADAQRALRQQALARLGWVANLENYRGDLERLGRTIERTGFGDRVARAVGMPELPKLPDLRAITEGSRKMIDQAPRPTHEIKAAASDDADLARFALEMAAQIEKKTRKGGPQ
jgi:hypothetical protein